MRHRDAPVERNNNMNESKTRRDWEEEADTFIFEWRKATDADPTFDDVRKKQIVSGKKR